MRFLNKINQAINTYLLVYNKISMKSPEVGQYFEMIQLSAKKLITKYVCCFATILFEYLIANITRLDSGKAET